MPPITQALLIANVAIFLLQEVAGNMLIYYFALWPLNTPPFLPSFQVWQLISYAFLHGSLMHLAFNMYGVYMFGSAIERVLGPRRYLALYFGSALSAGAMQLIVTASLGSTAPTVGASGALFGLLVACAMYFPTATLQLIIPPMPIQMRWFVILYGGLELYLGVTGTTSGIAHFAHLGGLLGGWLLVRNWRGQPPFGRRRLR